jgi:hypothetical protein
MIFMASLSLLAEVFRNSHPVAEDHLVGEANEAKALILAQDSRCRPATEAAQ